jgi:nucleoside-diphosphate-sugar epimerase
MSGFWRDTRVLVGGGCGFLGSYLVPALVRAGARVVVVDNLENGERGALAPVEREVTFIEADLRDRAACDALLPQSELFVNLAANASGVGFSRAHHGAMLIDNVLCGLVPLQAAHRHGLRHVVLTSTSCVYPDDAPVPTPELDALTGRPETVNEGYEDPLVIWGSGEQRRNFLHGSDAAEIIMRVIASGAEGPVNVGYEDDVRIADLFALICDVSGRHPQAVFDRSRPDGAARKSADSTRLRALTAGYVPKVSLRQGIEEMVGWYHRTFADEAKSVRVP